MIIHGLLPVGDEILDVYHSFVTSVGELSCRTNIFVAICTTAESGIHLSSSSFRCKIACCAWMDSVMYTVSLGLKRLPRGKYLGQLKDELFHYLNVLFSINGQLLCVHRKNSTTKRR